MDQGIKVSMAAYLIAGLAVLLLYVFAVASLYWLQGRWVYPGERHTLAHDLEVDSRFVWVTAITADGLGVVCRYCPAPSQTALCVVLFHGNGEDLRQRSVIAECLADEGYGVLQAEYRGFAGNPGKPGEAGLYADGRAALALLEGAGTRIVIHGYSLGSGVAVQLAAERPCAGLILEAPFTSVIAVARTRLPWLPINFLIRDRYDSLAKIGRVNAPILIYGGDHDRVIPPSHFEQLYRAANPPCCLAVINGAGHIDAWAAGGEHHVLEFLHRLSET